VSSVPDDLKAVPGIRFVDHVAIAVKHGDLEDQVKAYEMLGFKEIHREEVLGTDQVREALLQIGDGPNLIQLLEPLTPESPVQKRRPRRIRACGIPRGERSTGIRLHAGQRLSTHRQGSAQRFEGNHSLFCSPQIESRQSIWVSH